ncbi:uncharacterized protein L201_006237 [Kwoniella dendrophila CBS 6074]|uniref:Uncharacterized protein n=1 Tax=Kwoniella dendrophila CBS 6074 TaxID=1295534 RepID=A0AAX4K280_9TREE
MESLIKLVSDLQTKIKQVKFQDLPQTVQKQYGKIENLDLNELVSVNWNELPENIKNYVKENPKQTAFYVMNGIVFFAPSLVWSPILAIAGFTGIGPAASSIASFAQSFFHPVVQKSAFAIFQSAQMGGYGVGLMNAGVRTYCAISSVGCYFGGCSNEEDKGELEDEAK